MRARNQAVAERFGRNLRRARRRADLSQEELAGLADLHRTEIGHLEHGKRTPRIDTLVKLAAVVEASADQLLDGIVWVPSYPRDGEFVVSSTWVGGR